METTQELARHVLAKTAGKALAQREKLLKQNEQLRAALAALVISMEETLDTRQCDIKHLRRLNEARGLLSLTQIKA